MCAVYASLYKYMQVSCTCLHFPCKQGMEMAARSPTGVLSAIQESRF